MSTKSAHHFPSLTRPTVQANVMLAYPLSEAEELLLGKLEAARSSLANCEEDLDFLREQITVSSILPFRHVLEIAVTRWAVRADMRARRRWRLLPHACTTGTSDSAERRRATAVKDRLTWGPRAHQMDRPFGVCAPSLDFAQVVHDAHVDMPRYRKHYHMLPALWSSLPAQPYTLTLVA